MMGRPEDERVARNMIARCSEAIIPHSLATETAVSRLSPRGEEGGEREGRWRGREGRNIQDIISRLKADRHSPVIMTVRRAAEVRVEMTGVVSGFRRFCITIRPSNTRSHSTTSLSVGGGGGEMEGVECTFVCNSLCTTTVIYMFSMFVSVVSSLPAHRMTLSALCHGMCIVLCPTASTRKPL